MQLELRALGQSHGVPLEFHYIKYADMVKRVSGTVITTEEIIPL
jgi:hypothetical protein